MKNWSKTKRLIWQYAAKRISSDYIPLDYVTLANSAWIDTGKSLSSENVVRMKYRATTAGNVFGCYTTAEATDNFSYYQTNNGTQPYWRWDGNLYRSPNTPSSADHVLIWSKDGINLDGNNTPVDAAEFECSAPLYLGYLYGSSSAKMTGRIYYFKVDGVLDLAPVKRKADNVCGLLDKLSGTFYTSEGDPFGAPA